VSETSRPATPAGTPDPSMPPSSPTPSPPSAPSSPSSRLGALLLASRPKTLPAAVVPVAVGSAVALAHGGFALGPALGALAVALLVQIGTNYANDYFDFVQGADTEERIGPTRAVQAGLLTPGQMLTATVATFALAAVAGAYLARVAGWPLVWVGLASIAAGVWYTAGGRWSMGYLGLGDVFAFTFFGPVAVATTAYVQALVWLPEALLASLPIGFLVTAILVVNNFRDIDTDRVAGKHTLAVRFGRTVSRAEWIVLVAAAFAAAPLHWALGFAGSEPWVLLPLAALPLTAAPLRALLEPHERAGHGPRLNRALGQTAKLLLAYGALYALGIAL